MSAPIRPEPDLVCRQCGQPEAHCVGEEILCAACYHALGSCGAVREIEFAPEIGEKHQHHLTPPRPASGLR